MRSIFTICVTSFVFLYSGGKTFILLWFGLPHMIQSVIYVSWSKTQMSRLYRRNNLSVLNSISKIPSPVINTCFFIRQWKPEMVYMHFAKVLLNVFCIVYPGMSTFRGRNEKACGFSVNRETSHKIFKELLVLYLLSNLNIPVWQKYYVCRDRGVPIPCAWKQIQQLVWVPFPWVKLNAEIALQVGVQQILFTVYYWT